MVGKESHGPRYLGIDMGSDSGKTTCVWLCEERDAEGKAIFLRSEICKGGYSGTAGLERLLKLTGDATLCAINSPFGYPRATLALLNARAAGSTVDEDYRFRATDLAMRDRLRFLDLPVSYVISPVRREVVRRTLVLLVRAGANIAEARSGVGRFFETHGRLAVVELLARCHPSWGLQIERPLLAAYRRGEKKLRDKAKEARRTILFRLGNELNQHCGKGFLKFSHWRQVAADPSLFEAFFCAFAALAQSRAASLTYPQTPPPGTEVVQKEGLVTAPAWPRLWPALAPARPQ